MALAPRVSEADAAEENDCLVYSLFGGKTEEKIRSICYTFNSRGVVCFFLFFDFWYQNVGFPDCFGGPGCFREDREVNRNKNPPMFAKNSPEDSEL